ncbi:response regulator [Allocoleopsis sp.]|uniref:response regulator n=1 Tax=Allocoleopsis sp. TaxID=3088169 RepID=UPI002FD51878
MNDYILVVDDEESIRENIQDSLELEGYTVKIAASAEEALYMAFAETPSLILCDVRMGDRDSGFRVLERIRLNDSTKNTPFVFISAAVEKAAIRKGMNLGADDYLTKPYTRDELLETVRVRLNRVKEQPAPKPLIPYILLKSRDFPEEGQKFELSGYLIIGRKKECNVRVSDPYTSAIACTIIPKVAGEEKSAAWIHDGAIVKKPTQDTRSRYGVWVNGYKIDGQAELRGGEVVVLSPATCFEYHVPSAEEKIDATQSSEQ